MKSRVYGCLLVLVLAGCGGTSPAPVAPVSPPAVAEAGAISTDVAWSQLMIALDQRMLAALELAPQRTADKDLSAFATDVARRHEAEVVRLRELLQATGAPETNPHEGHDMPGMITKENLALLATKSGTAFDTMLADSLRTHFEQCRMLAGSEQSAGADPAVKALAASVETTRQADLDRLATLTGPR
ncbi:DUF305 domain-containing protein [Catellatospora vulcania]|uniref:DUF305 domain-containing protein n=1 Tax=Catellatospora vulcania TaxID=1460450 RepID=UPI0012D3F5C9|nr:DUF305 domain-containing protein [Catellatospora vulcania]